MYILGISCYYHDSAACLVKDGQIVAAAEEERFSRIKHDNGFPYKSIQFCLDHAGITIHDLESISFYEKPVLKFQRIINQHLHTAPFSFGTFKKFFPSWTKNKIKIESKIRELGYERKGDAKRTKIRKLGYKKKRYSDGAKKRGYQGKIHFIEHHLSHAASTFFPSPFKEAAFLTIDGVGEWATTTYGLGKDNKIKILNEIAFPHSLGLLYSTITAYLGFTVNNSEYKVMGLSPYGDPKPYYNHFRRMIDIKQDGSFRLRMKYFDFHYREWMPSKEMCRLLGGPVRDKEGELTQRHKDIAAALQKITEEIVIKILNHVHQKTKLDNICLAGGVALNSVANGKILSQTPFKRVWIQPAAGDSGNAIGAALLCYHQVFGKKQRYRQEHAYYGPGYDDKQIKEFLDSHLIKYAVFKDQKKLVRKLAKLIHSDHVISWFQGRMEWGPRALGSRSILSNPCNPNMQAILNEKVKHREKFRPFAPVVCEDDALKYFECDQPVPLPTDFMLMVYPVRKRWHQKIPAVTHVDGSGRLQTIRRRQNPLYYDLIKAYGKLSGIPILINTSFNIRGEPIVCTPKDAYSCMMGTGIDYLVMGKYLIRRADNPQDMWDSEALADD